MGERAPRVSVVMPAHNHQDYVQQALDSVREEGYPNLEIVVIDDGSTDATWGQITTWEAANQSLLTIRVFRQENAGLTRTLNRLLDLAQGPYVVYLASDDRLLPGGIAARVEMLEAHPELTAVFGDCRVVDGSGQLLRERGMALGDGRAPRRMLADAAREIVANWGITGSVILYRRDAIRALGGYSEDLMIEDWDFYLRLASRREIAFLDRIVSEYRWHGANTVVRSTVAIRVADEMRRVAWRSRRLFRGHLYLELVHESATWAARSARLRGRPFKWVAWKGASVGLKLVAMAWPRRSSDQVGATHATRETYPPGA